MTRHNQAIRALNLWCRILARSLAETEYQLSPRQMMILLHVYLGDPPHTVKSIADSLNISKAAVCRAVDILCGHSLLRRKRDAVDKRNVFIQRTVKGSVYLSEMADIINDETKEFG